MILVRFILQNELQLVQNIREIVFVQGQKVPFEIERDGFDESCMHIIAFFNDTPVGTARIRKIKEGSKLERIAVLSEYRKKGIGTKIIEFAINQLKGKTILLNAQFYLLDYYKKFGFKEYGKKFFEAGIEHIKMKKII